MAKIIETVFLIKLSQLVKDKSDSVDTSSFDELTSTLEQVVQELVSTDIIVEVEKAE